MTVSVIVLPQRISRFVTGDTDGGRVIAPARKKTLSPMSGHAI